MHYSSDALFTFYAQIYQILNILSHILNTHSSLIYDSIVITYSKFNTLRKLTTKAVMNDT